TYIGGCREVSGDTVLTVTRFGHGFEHPVRSARSVRPGRGGRSAAQQTGAADRRSRQAQRRRTRTEGNGERMHPGTLIVILLVLCAVGAVVAAVAVRHGNARRRVSREEFARQIGAREHDPRSGTRPSFGHFPEKDRYTGVPFTYAMEFTRSGVPVVASEVRSGGPNTQVRHVGTVQVPSGLPVDAPPLMVGEHWRWVIDPDTLQRVRALDGFPDSRIRAMCGDEEFARRVVTPELAAVFAAH